MNFIKKLFVFSIILVLTQVSSLFAKDPERPKLVVGIVLDQMRWDYLQRYQDRYSEKGFKRLMKDGFNCENAEISYLPTFTAPGHASIYTGSVPALHGIVGNNWIDRRTGRSWYCTEDTTVKSVGGGKAGLMSPRNMKTTTIADELKLASNFRSKTFGISIKDRGAILPAGHSADGAYWYDSSNGKFISSSYYHDILPKWLEDFNQRNIHDSLMNEDWQTLYPIETYVQSTADDNRYEGIMKGQERPVFPHRTSLAVKANDKSLIRTTPQGNTITRMMAEACILAEGLGKGSETDFLALSFSSPDYIGHVYGPNSIEVEDSYLRMDLELAAFLEFLDREIGTGSYLVFLSADHGAAHNALFLEDHKIPAKGLNIKIVENKLNQHLASTFNVGDLVKSLMNYQVHYDEELIISNSLNRDEIRKESIQWLRVQEGVTAVLDMENPEKMMTVELLKTRSANGYYSNRSGGIQFILDAGWYSAYAETGTTHGSWNPYDAHIPLIFYGWGVNKGKLQRTVYMTDIAATLSAILKIQSPNGNIGSVIEEVVK